MGQAKLRGSREERITQSKARKRSPEKGVYVSTKKADWHALCGWRCDAWRDEEGFFLVQMIEETSADDMSAMGDELDPDEWFSLVEQYGLVKSDS